MAASNAKISVMVVDDHPALLVGLCSLLSSEAGIQVLSVAASGEEACNRYRSDRPDVVVMDLSMKGFGGMEAIRRILLHDPLARILVYSVHSADVMLSRALKLGALGFVSKASETDVLIQAVREVVQRRGFVSPDLVPAMVRQHAMQEHPLIEQLGNREFQIFLLISQGLKVDECALTLNLSEKTVRNHLTRIKALLKVVNTAELTRLAIRTGLVEP